MKIKKDTAFTKPCHFLRVSVGGLRESLGKTGLFAVGCILVQHALSDGFIESAEGIVQQGLSLRRLFGNSGVKLLNRGLQGRLDHAVAKVLLFIHLHALDGGLDIRQIVHLLVRESQRLYYHAICGNASLFFKSADIISAGNAKYRHIGERER